MASRLASQLLSSSSSLSDCTEGPPAGSADSFEKKSCLYGHAFIATWRLHGVSGRNQARDGWEITHREDALDHEVVEFLERRLVRLAERCRKLGGLVLLGDLERLAGELQAAQEPHQTLGRRPLLLALFVLHELLERARQCGGRVVACADFLCGAYQIGDHSQSSWVRRRTAMLPFRSLCTGANAADASRSGLALVFC